ncbi:hypothetical protein TL16_g00711 [Triparma laevis f. inornata]|uniref:LamG domain-containing protein n=1 Tax=Triparma laevis f. inornata TaxID=1714386 RepID=A0A9W6ZFK1_9STRA|nr:hypothetical protein TL16_g00711 [Triparma laevis f. inornata]
MKMYKNGALTGTKTDGHEPNVLTRTHHTIGAFNGGTGSFMDGTIAYVKVWHGVELQQSDVTDLYAPDATPMNGPACSADGLSLDGTNDYADIDDWEWGGTTSFEVYVKCDGFNSYSRVFDFGSGGGSDKVYLANHGTTSTIGWRVCQGSAGYQDLTTSKWDYSTWTHAVFTVSGTNMKMYKNGVLVGTQTDGYEPNVLTRTQH